MSTESSTQRIGPITLAPSITRANGWTFLYSAFVSIGLLTFITIGQTYILNEHLKVPISEQGRISGDLVFWTEIVALLLFVPAGVLIDRIGRRPVFVAGLLLLAATYAFYPFATTTAELFLFRTIYAFGIVAVAGGLSTVLVDYPAERSRGKLVAVVGFLNGLGIVLINQGLGSLPKVFAGQGASGTEAGLYTHLVIAALAVISAVILAVGLKGGTPVARRERPPLKELVVSGFAAARNPRILLAYGAAFIARGDQSINATFLVLWGTTAAIAAGMDSAEAVKNGTFIFVISQLAALVWAPLLGPVIDRLNRVTALGLGMALGALGNLAVLALDDPLATYGIFFFVLLGIGQISVFLSAQSLIGQEAPEAKRGSVLGAFNIAGAIGILLITTSGGRLFDGIDPRAPFVVVGTINVLLMLASLYVRLRAPGKAAAEIEAERLRRRAPQR
ncbi:arabinose efflux permease family protein [Thioflavicoccus mobilis 8321]|uniref:Arabinose efflux permease family protein n=1 Tax=Thioflavicoccus mobilis 8321 TaxID=765912 RepID=L0H194_9GAMM|nr:MFS transporter [Thioflavicoccus mobilis]AGA91966.1 arabinose efflux permease family protein [Thioflavicoccus mobilis 8321]